MLTSAQVLLNKGTIIPSDTKALFNIRSTGSNNSFPCLISSFLSTFFCCWCFREIEMSRLRPQFNSDWSFVFIQTSYPTLVLLRGFFHQIYNQFNAVNKRFRGSLHGASSCIKQNTFVVVWPFFHMTTACRNCKHLKSGSSVESFETATFFPAV